MNRFKFNLKDKNLIAPCGLYCGECSAFQDRRCGGCLSRSGLCLKYTEICKIYSCCLEKRGLRFCGECEEFPCGKFKRFFDTQPWYNEAIENSQRIKKIGLDKFLNEQVKRVNRLIICVKKHGLSHCGQCKGWPCEKLKRSPLTPA